MAGAGSATEATFAVVNEDHTLGNAVRYMLNKNPNVSFTGYSVPHPSEELVNIRVQTTGQVSASHAMRESLTGLKVICDHVGETFTASVDEFRERKAEGK
mmetsp:Transcript_7862/g.26271  ORF Transcript_7862/g.26271 Transcript_7862/m.26271 type:complete len:100 (+) Transcript_7862:154-453(+)